MSGQRAPPLTQSTAEQTNHRKSPPPPPPEMDPKIWKHLPVELLERVLTFLPLKSFLPLRSTSKHFNSLIFSPPFISQHSSPSPSTPISSFLLLSHPQLHFRYFLYDTAFNTWRTLPLPLPPQLSCAALFSTSSSLLCFSNSSFSFLVYNLLSGQSRQVKFPQYPFSFGKLTLVSTQIGYKIFLLSSSSASSSVPSDHAFVYDSAVHLWRKFDGLGRSITRGNFHQQGVLFNGFLYFVTPEPFSIVSFDMDTGKWDRLLIQLPEEMTFVRLASDPEGNRLFMFGKTARNGISGSMKLWELNRAKDGWKWAEVETVPELMCKKLGSVCYHNYEHIYCYWHMGMICVCCYTWPEILYYKVSTRTWHWLPKCPALPEKWSCGFRWFSFVPQLRSSV